MKRIAMAALAVALTSGAVRAEWMHKKEENPFDGDAHIAFGLTDMSGYSVGFRCKNSSDLQIVFVTPEKTDKADDSDLIMMSRLGIKLLVIVDDSPKEEFVADADRAPGDLLRIVAEAGAIDALLRKVMAAKKRVAIAAQFAGKAMHPKSFDVRGSRKALEALEAGCKLGATN